VTRISPNTKVYAFTFLESEVLDKHGIHGGVFSRLLNFHTDRPMDTDEMENMLMIIDKGQASYQYGNLWVDYIKRISSDQYRGRRVVLFSSYGSPTEIPRRHSLVGSPQSLLTPNQRVSIRPLSDNNQKVSLYFTRPEFDDVVARVRKLSGKTGQPFNPSPELLDHVWEFSNGHPAGVRVVLDGLINSEVSAYSCYCSN
jgi:hypothetical protein